MKTPVTAAPAEGKPLYDPLDPQFLKDPTPYLHHLREVDPVHWSEQLGVWVLSRYEDCKTIGQDRRFSFKPEGFGANLTQEQSAALASAAQKDLMRAQQILPHCFNWMDPPDHTRIRKLVMRAFGAAAVDELRHPMRQYVGQLLDRVGNEFDLVQDFAFPLPYLIICGVLGFPDDMVDDARAHMMNTEKMVAPEPEGDVFTQGLKSMVWLADEVEKLCESRRKEAKDDLISALVQAEEDGDKLVGDELVATVMALFGAANTGTQRMIANGLVALIRNRDQMELLYSDIDKYLESTVEEMLRYHQPNVLTNTPRYAMEDMEIRGKKIKRGDSVRLLTGIANRDPEVFEDPDKFDITRKPNPHITFGGGIHICPGLRLARAEGQEAVRGFLNRFGTSAVLLDEQQANSTQLLWEGFDSVPIRVG